MTTPPPVSRQRWLIPVVVVVLSVTVGGGLLAREVYQRPELTADAPIASSTSTVPLSPAEEPGPATIKVTPDVAGHPQENAVAATLETYFESINVKDYKLWSSVATAARIASQSQTDWRNGVRSTRDGSILVYRIERGANDSLRVLVGFTSVQKPEDGPPDLQVGCIRWRLVLPMVKPLDSDGLKIDTTDGVSPDHEQC